MNKLNSPKMFLYVSSILVVCMICILLNSCNQNHKVSHIDIARGTAEVNFDYDITEKTYWNLLNVDNIIETIHNMKIMSLEPSNDLITDVEYLRFDITFKNNEVRTLWLLYDFILKKEYVLFEKQLYLLHDYSALWEQTIKIQLYECGDARFYRNSDIDTMTFRYEQHWTDGYDYDNLVYCRYDFSNIEQYAEQFKSNDDAVKYCTNILKLDNCQSLCFYDTITGNYFIEFYNNDSFSTLNEESIVNESLGKGPHVIYAVIDENGEIIELYSMGIVIYKHRFE